MRIPTEIRHLFDDPPLLASEDRHGYFKLFSAIADDIRPDSTIEWFWVKDVVLQIWDIHRLWAFRNHFIEAERRRRADKMAIEALKQQCKEDYPECSDSDIYCFIRENPPDPQTKRELTPKLDTEADSAQAYGDASLMVETLDQQIASLERRRDNTLREIELRREILARRARQAAAKLIEVKDSEVPVAAE